MTQVSSHSRTRAVAAVVVVSDREAVVVAAVRSRAVVAAVAASRSQVAVAPVVVVAVVVRSQVAVGSKFSVDKADESRALPGFFFAGRGSQVAGSGLQLQNELRHVVLIAVGVGAVALQYVRLKSEPFQRFHRIGLEVGDQHAVQMAQPILTAHVDEVIDE